MKIVHIIHGFPPYNMAGSEVYTYNLARELAMTEDVYVFHRIADPERDEYELSFDELEGIKICTINNTFKFCTSFEQTYKNKTIAKKFADFLDDVQPEVAHFGHLTCLSTTLIEEAKKRGIPVVFTLHDFWLFCQLGQLLKRDLSLCSGPKDSECARCLAPQLAVKGGVKKASEIIRKTLPNFHDKTRLGRIIRGMHLRYARVFFRFQNEAHLQIQARTAHIKEMCSLVDLFIAPSRFLSGEFLKFGIPVDKIVYDDYGFNTTSVNNLVKKASRKVRFGYIGTFIPSKGVHILLDAFKMVKNQNAELRIHGKFLPYHPGFEDYPDYLRSLAKSDNVCWFGEYHNKNIAGILSEIDILVVPSIWYENSPLTIHEAFMADIPVITSNIGGMAELVQDNVNGLQFMVGDSRDLAKKMQLVMDDPSLIDRLRRNIRPVTALEDHVVEIRAIYDSLVSKREILREEV